MDESGRDQATTTIHYPLSTIHSIVKVLSAITIVSGILVLLGWFTLPVRIVMLAALLSLLCRATWGQRSLVRSFIIHHSSFIIPTAAAAAAAALLLWHSGTTDPIRSPWSVVPTPFFFLYALVASMAIFVARTGDAEGGSPTARSNRARWGSAAAGPVSAALLLSSLVAILVYPLGFGFDHFIHAAAEHIIAATGSLSPPPLFYSGHSGLTVLLADLLPWVDVALADRLVTPLLILFLVPLAYRALRSVLPEHAARWGLSSLLIVPFLPFVVSTPQATANIFALATIFSLFLCARVDGSQRGGMPTSGALTTERAWSEAEGRGSEGGIAASAHAGQANVPEVGARPQLGATPLLTALAALLAQPMTGIIAIAIVAMAFTLQRGWRVFSAAVAALGAVGIPLAFAIAGRIIPNLDLRVALDPLPAMQRLGYALADALRIAATDFATADALEVDRIVLPMLWIGLAMSGTIALVRHSAPKNQITISKQRPLGNYGNSFLLIAPPLIAVVAAALVAATVTVPTQLAEEQAQFPLRLLQLAALLATPLVSIGLARLNFASQNFGGLGRVRGQLPQLATAVAFAAAATFTLLLAYPRDDAQARSGLWSVSADDIAAVHAIANDADGVPYVVLANQMLGAAAIREFGFRPSYRVPISNVGAGLIPARAEGREVLPYTEILAFPLPAGGPIAQQFWAYVSQLPPSQFSTIVENWDGRAPIDSAIDLVNADRAYIVLHDYWRNYDRFVAETSTLADAEIGSFKHLRVFRFDWSQ